MSILIRLLLIASLIIAVLASPGLLRHTGTLAATPALNHLYGSGQVTGGRNLALRVELTSPAPTGGVRVRLASTSLLVAVPGSVLIPSGETDLAFTVPTGAVQSTQPVSVQAEFNGKIKTRVVLVVPPALKELSVQTRMRAGGYGKVTLFLSAPAPQGGIQVDITSNRPSLFTLPSPIVIPPGKSSLSITASVGNVSRDTEVNIIARLNGQKLVSPSVIRNYDRPSATPTQTATTPESSATPTQNPTQTPTTGVLTATTSPGVSTSTSTATMAPTSTWTPTLGPIPEVQMAPLHGHTTALKGSMISFSVCLDRVPDRQIFISFRSSDEVISLTTSISPTQWLIPAGTSGAGLCQTVSMLGRSESGDNVGLGPVNLIANLNGEEFISPAITFVNPTPTPAETFIATSTYSSTPMPSSTPASTQTSAPPASSTATEPPTNTVAPISTLTVTMSPTPETTEIPETTATGQPATPTSTPFPITVSIDIPSNQVLYERGQSVLFNVCLSNSPGSEFFVSFRSSEERVAVSDAINPTSWPFPAGAHGSELCLPVELYGASGPGPQNGIGQVNLIANAYGIDVYSTVVTFVPIAENPSETATVPSATLTPSLTATYTPTPTPVSPTPPSTFTATPVPPTRTSTSVPPTETATPHPPTETATHVETPTQNPSMTSTTVPPSETPTNSPSSTETSIPPTDTPNVSGTATPTPNPEPIRIDLVGTQIEFVRGSSVSFNVCIEAWVGVALFVSTSSGNLIAVPDANIAPGTDFIPAGECHMFVASGRTGFGGDGLGSFFLIVNLDGTNYQGPTVLFVPE